MDRVAFTQMKDGTKEEYEFLTAHEIEYTKGTADRLLTALVELDESLSGYKVTRLGHSVQSATRAWRDGADTDWVVSALLHEIGDIYAPTITTNTRPRSSNPFCANNAPGSCRRMAISR